MRPLLLAACSLCLLTGPALADRDVTPEERAKIDLAILAYGCTATDMEYDEDDRLYEVDDATCGDGRTYDMELDRSFAIVGGERPLSEDERVQINIALEGEGCSGGRAEFDIDDDRFEVDKAVCADGQTFDLKFDKSYKLIKKKRDD